MQSTGKLLFSTTHNNDIHFQQSIILIAEHNTNGAIGFVVNKMFERGLNELAEFSNSPSFPLYAGGPVSKEHLYFIHRRNDVIPGGTLIEKDIFYGGDFKQAITLINNHKLTTNDIKIFIGYCGWDKEELETEIYEGSWEMKNFSSNLVFSS